LSFLLCIETANPKHVHLQSEVIDFYINSMGINSESIARKIRIIASKSGIRKRHSVLKDFSLTPENFTFFPKNKFLEPVPNLSQRMQLFKENALPLSLEAINKIDGLNEIKEKITHIISVTCTGLYAPGLDIEIIESLKLKPTTNRSSINFMGCNAAILALKQADQICSSKPEAIVLIVCVELCTIHFQKKTNDDYILSNLLFADGAAAALIGGENIKISNKYKACKIVSFRSLIINEGKNDMAWQISETGFIMNLTSYISPLLNSHLPKLLEEMIIKKNDDIVWAIHPGGKKIIDDFCKSLSLPPERLKYSYETLEEFGNMSSSTILFVLKLILENEIGKKDIFTAAFGPGLSVETAVMQTL
jgi:alpha-pyrone synthase